MIKLISSIPLSQIIRLFIRLNRLNQIKSIWISEIDSKVLIKVGQLKTSEGPSPAGKISGHECSLLKEDSNGSRR